MGIRTENWKLRKMVTEAQDGWERAGKEMLRLREELREEKARGRVGLAAAALLGLLVGLALAWGWEERPMGSGGEQRTAVLGE